MLSIAGIALAAGTVGAGIGAGDAAGADKGCDAAAPGAGAYCAASTETGEAADARDASPAEESWGAVVATAASGAGGAMGVSGIKGAIGVATNVAAADGGVSLCGGADWTGVAAGDGLAGSWARVDDASGAGCGSLAADCSCTTTAALMAAGNVGVDRPVTETMDGPPRAP